MLLALLWRIQVMNRISDGRFSTGLVVDARYPDGLATVASYSGKFFGFHFQTVFIRINSRKIVNFVKTSKILHYIPFSVHFQDTWVDANILQAVYATHLLAQNAFKFKMRYFDFKLIWSLVSSGYFLLNSKKLAEVSHLKIRKTWCMVFKIIHNSWMCRNISLLVDKFIDDRAMFPKISAN